MSGERQTETHQAERWTLEICSHCGAEAGAGIHGHSDFRDWFWRKVVVAPEARVAELEAERDRAVEEWTAEIGAWLLGRYWLVPRPDTNPGGQ